MHYPKIKTFRELNDEVLTHLKNKLPFVLYRKPFENRVTCLLQEDNSLNFTVDFSEKGFVFAPFDVNDNTILLRADKTVSVDFEGLSQKKVSKVETYSDGKEGHLSLVRKGIAEIKKGNLKKVVLSRKMEVEFSANPGETFNNLLANYPNAFCYWFYHPKVGMWCGATPETLVQIKDGNLRTMSLAATTPYKNAEVPTWGDKEIDEQQMVSDYISGRLSSKLKTLNVSKAESIKAGNLWHLKSEITGKLSIESNLKGIIMSLHPTPAVCGIPTEDAKAFITKNEDYERKYYTGFLGELNLWGDKEISFYVNLRCMELKENAATIFVGGGITKASVPESEWVETQNKSKTMLNII
ncbi:MAG: isochorismate synthase [Allomuricauda sp.]